jgi:type II secretion system protein H
MRETLQPCTVAAQTAPQSHDCLGLRGSLHVETGHAGNGRHGFTLIELIIVLTIIVIMSAAVVPVFGSSMAKLERDHAVRDFVATLRYAQERAVTDTREYRLALDPELNQYWLLRCAGIVERKKTFELIDERQGKAMFLPERLSMKSVKARKERQEKYYYISFYPNGACDRAEVTLQHEDGRAVTVETKGSLGQLEVKEK